MTGSVIYTGNLFNETKQMKEGGITGVKAEWDWVN